MQMRHDEDYREATMRLQAAYAARRKAEAILGPEVIAAEHARLGLGNRRTRRALAARNRKVA